jgi:RecJ-like exonuclease
MRLTGLSYPAACSAVLDQDPSLYQQYVNEKAAGETTYVAKGKGESAYIDDPEDSSDEDCPNCQRTGKVKGRTCSNCGGTGEAVTAGDDTEKAKKALLKKLDEIESLSARVNELESALKTRR